MTAVRLDPSDLGTVQDHGTVVAITGTELAQPFRRVTFAGDHRSMAGLVAILEDGHDVDAAVEPWQILGRSA